MAPRKTQKRVTYTGAFEVTAKNGTHRATGIGGKCNVAEDNTAMVLLANVMVERDALLANCMRLREERIVFQRTAALYCTERQNMILECNMMRESALLDRMMLEAEQLELDKARYHFMTHGTQGNQIMECHSSRFHL
jgi:hypothetical protein